MAMKASGGIGSVVAFTSLRYSVRALAHLRRGILLTAALLALAGCDAFGPTPVSRPAAIDLGGTWTTVSVPGIVIADRLEAPQVQFTDGGRIEGATGCNDFEAVIEIDGEALTVGPVDTGEPAGGGGAACTARARQIEAAFAFALTQADRITADPESGRLIISGAGGEIVLTQPAVQPEP